MQAAARLAFGPWLLDPRGSSLTRDGARVDLSPYQYQVLHLLVQRAGEVLSKDALGMSRSLLKLSSGSGE